MGIGPALTWHHVASRASGCAEGERPARWAHNTSEGAIGKYGPRMEGCMSVGMCVGGCVCVKGTFFREIGMFY